MASIPLPALHVQPPADPAEGIQRLMAMRQMMQQGQLTQAEIQQRNIANQVQQQALKDQQTILGLYQKHGGDLDKVVQDAPNAGVSPGAIQQLQLHAIDVKTKTQDLVAKQGTEAARQADLMLGAHDIVDKASPDQRPQVYQQQVASLQKQGVDVSQLPPEYPGDEAFKLLGLTARAHSKNVEDALKVAQTSEATAKAGEATAQTGKITAETNPDNPTDPNFRKAKYEGILQKIQQGGLKAITPQEYQFAQSYELGQRKTESSSQSDTLGVVSNSTHTTQPSGLMGAIQGSRKGQASTPGPQGISQPTAGTQPGSGGQGQKPPNPQSLKENIVDMVGKYDYDPAKLSRLMIKHPELLGMIRAKYPDFDDTNYNAKNALIKGYTSGTQSKEINAINTAMGHIKNLDDAIDAMNNGDLTLLNKIGTAYNINVAGKTAEAAFKLIVHRVGPEIANAYIPGGGGQAERMADEKDFDVNLPPQTLHNNAAITVNMLRSKIGALENQYKNTVQRDDFQQRFITPEARASLQKMSAPNPGTQGGGKAETRTYQGHTYVKQADGSWKLQ